MAANRISHRYPLFSDVITSIPEQVDVKQGLYVVLLGICAAAYFYLQHTIRIILVISQGKKVSNLIINVHIIYLFWCQLTQ